MMTYMGNNQVSSEELKRRIINRWDEASKYYDYDRFTDEDINSKVRDTWKEFFNKELGSERLKILDVGTGTGFLSILLAEMGHEVVGIDLSEMMISLCSKKAQEKDLQLDLRIGDAESIPFENECFDVVVSRWVLWTVLHPEKAITDWKRVLKPGGRAYAFDTPSVEREANTIDKYFRPNLAKLVISIYERRNAWSEYYDKVIRSRLPLNYDKKGSFDRQMKLFVDCGFMDVAATKMDEASALSAEIWGRMPWRYQLGWTCNYEWYCIRGSKAVEPQEKDDHHFGEN